MAAPILVKSWYLLLIEKIVVKNTTNIYLGLITPSRG
jgi:hypothetical protein